MSGHRVQQRGPQLEPLLARLERELDAGSVAVAPGTPGEGDGPQPGSSGFEVDGLAAAARVTPADEEQLAVVLRLCAEAGVAVAVCGRGSKQHWGLPLTTADLILDTARIRAGWQHDREDLVVTTPAGFTWSEVQVELARSGQWIPLDPPLAGQASVGGVVATASSGLRRLAYGAVRDLVIGARAVLSDGRQVRAGGRVIKNVAGYDLCKLLVGSVGALAVVTEVTWKVAPLPPQHGWVRAAFADFGQLHAAALTILRSVLQPTTVYAVWPPGALGESAARAVELVVDVEGFEAVVTRQLRDLQQLLVPGAQALTAGGPRPIRQAADLTATLDAVIGGRGGDPLETVVRLGVPAAQMVQAVREAGQALGGLGGRPLHADLTTGLCWWSLPAGVPAQPAAAAVARLDAQLAARGGYALVESGPRSVRLDAAGYLRERLALSARLKRTFDARQVLGRGRLGDAASM
ncbi:MAG TPA: FAD-binding oxidoreductase [Bacillota bacterium]